MIGLLRARKRVAAAARERERDEKHDRTGVRGWNRNIQVTAIAGGSWNRARVCVWHMRVRAPRYATSRDAFRKCTLIRLPSTFAATAAAAVPSPHRTIEFSFPPLGSSMYTCIYVCHSNEKARVHCIVYLPLWCTYIGAHVRAACMSRDRARIDQRDATAEPWSDFNFYVELYVVFTVAVDETSTNRRTGRA